MKIDNRSAKVYTALYTYKNEHLDKNGMSYTQIKSWITNEDWLLKEEINVGVVEPKKIVFTRTYKYEYNPKNLKIEAPIK